MAHLAQPLLLAAANGNSTGCSATATQPVEPVESPFANGDQQDIEAARKEGEAEDASGLIARKVALAIWLSLFANVLLMAVKTAAYLIRWAWQGAAEELWRCRFSAGAAVPTPAACP